MNKKNNKELKHKVTSEAMHPGSSKKQCLYCQRIIGAYHKSDCVLIRKRVKVRATVEYEIVVPFFWDKSNIEFHRNDGSWCANNMIDELEELGKGDCLCGLVHFEYLEDASDSYLDES